jgi:hypothetical protein
MAAPKRRPEADAEIDRMDDRCDGGSSEELASDMTINDVMSSDAAVVDSTSCC